MKKLLFAALSLGVPLLGFLLVVLATPDTPVEPGTKQVASPRAETTASAPVGERSTPEEDDLVDAPQGHAAGPGETVAAELPADELRSVVTMLEGARTVGVWESGERRMARGRVELPAGLPTDPTLSVLAFRTEPSPSTTYGRFGALSRYHRDRRGIDAAAEDKAVLEEIEEREAPVAPAIEAVPEEAFAEDAPEGAAADDHVHGDAEAPAHDEEGAHDEDQEDADPDPSHLHGMVAIAPVAADGTFEIPFPADVECGWLTIDGRYLYSDSARMVTLSEAAEVVLRPSVGAWVTGEVQVPDDLSDAEATLEELRVTLSYDPSQFSFTGMDFGTILSDRLAVPDGNGRFEFRAVPTAPPYLLTVASDDLADATVSGIALEDARDRHIEVALVYGARVSGRVLDESDAPVAEVRVAAATGELFGFATNDVGRTETDEDGWFEFPHLPPGKVQLMARKPGYLDSKPERLQLVDLETRKGVVLKLSRGERVAGVVELPDGSPAAGVTVNLGFDPDALGSMAAFNAARGAEGVAVTAEDGTFEITGLGRGPFQVSVTHEIDDHGHAARVAPVKPGTLDLELRLRPDPVVSGVVTTADGVPIPEFQVRAELEAVAFWMGGDSVERDFEDEGGAFRLPGLREGKWKLRASAPGWSTSDWLPVDLPREEGAPPVQLVLYPEAIAAGVVLDPDGNPVAGATVRQELDLMATIADATGLDEIDAARTDEDGRFELGGLAEGGVSLVASHPDHVDSASASVELLAGQTTDGVVLKLRVGGTLTGEIFDAEGEPAGGVMIVLQETTNFIPTMLRSEPDGTFRREEVKPGKYQITAMLADVDATELFGDEEDEPDWTSFISNMKTDVAEVKEGEETHVVLGAPPADPVRLTGRVRHADGPVDGAMVTLFPEGGSGLGALKFTTTNDDGDFSVVLDHPGAYLLQVQVLGDSAMEQNAMEFPQTIPEGEEHRIAVDLPGGTISGRVLDRDGEPIPSTRVSLTLDGGVGLGSYLGKRYVETRTDSEGRYELRYLDPDVYVISAGGTIAGGAFGGAASAGRVVRGGIVLAEGQWIQDVDFRLKRPGEITGRVLDVTGSPVNGASIFVRDEQGYVLERFSMCSTDGAGRFRYSGVAPGKYTISARTGDLASLESSPVTVPEGGVGDAVITVEAGTTLNVSVVDQEGNLINPKILVTDEDGRQMNGMVSYNEIIATESRLYSTEEQAVGPLPPGRYTVTARAPDGRTVTKPVTLSGQAERRLKIRLK